MVTLYPNDDTGQINRDNTEINKNQISILDSTPKNPITQTMTNILHSEGATNSSSTKLSETHKFFTKGTAFTENLEKLKEKDAATLPTLLKDINKMLIGANREKFAEAKKQLDGINYETSDPNTKEQLDIFSSMYVLNFIFEKKGLELDSSNSSDMNKYLENTLKFINDVDPENKFKSEIENKLKLSNEIIEFKNEIILGVDSKLKEKFPITSNVNDSHHGSFSKLKDKKPEILEKLLSNELKGISTKQINENKEAIIDLVVSDEKYESNLKLLQEKLGILKENSAETQKPELTKNPKASLEVSPEALPSLNSGPLNEIQTKLKNQVIKKYPRVDDNARIKPTKRLLERLDSLIKEELKDIPEDKLKNNDVQNLIVDLVNIPRSDGDQIENKLWDINQFLKTLNK